MLVSWRLSQFKSVIDEVTLPLAPLTIFTGANSAGKSTIIQSMLLTAQSLQSSLVGRPVVLNGHMARLGTFSDLVSSADKSRRISVGFTLRPNEASLPPFPGSRRIWPQGLNYFHNADLSQIDSSYSFSAVPGPNDASGGELLDLQPALETSAVLVRYLDSESVERTDTIEVIRSSKSARASAEELRLDADNLQSDQLDTLKYTVKRTGQSYAAHLSVSGLEITTTPVGALMHHFVPRAMTVRYDEIDAQVAAQFELLSKGGTAHNARREQRSKAKISQVAADFIGECLDPLVVSDPEFAPLTSYGQTTLREAVAELRATRQIALFANKYRRLISKDVSQVLAVLDNKKAEIKKVLRGGRHQQYGLEYAYLGEKLAAGTEYIQAFFTGSVKYLGPLRDEPKPLYPLAGTSDPADVGFRGEHTAAVLHAYKSTYIEYMPSDALASNSTVGSEVQATLATAVQDWLSYMGVGRDFSTLDSGKLGHELKITTTASDLQHDLTQVGVGVSQVLPILVLALLADRGSTLIFEQPELHLHPKVQSRLADFFVAMNMLGKQCIVETHSEYLINRLRFRAASSNDSVVSDSVIIYFVEKPADKSNYRQVRIDDLGSLDNWPDGFFDESERGTAALLKMSLEKRRRKSSAQ